VVGGGGAVVVVVVVVAALSGKTVGGAVVRWAVEV